MMLIGFLCGFDIEKDSLGPHKLDMRVGRVIKVKRRPEKDALYMLRMKLVPEKDPFYTLKVDVGEPELRTIVSGLANFVPI